LSFGLCYGFFAPGEQKRLYGKIDNVSKATKPIVDRMPDAQVSSNGSAKRVIGTMVVAGQKS
jgi:hypothetical protein